VKCFTSSYNLITFTSKSKIIDTAAGAVNLKYWLILVYFDENCFIFLYGHPLFTFQSGLILKTPSYIGTGYL